MSFDGMKRKTDVAAYIEAIEAQAASAAAP
jgi:hypothetical protein